MKMNPVYVRQKELEEIAEHEREIAWRSKRLEELQSNVIILLRGGAQVELGRFDAELQKRIGRNVPWKQRFIEALGIAAAELVNKQYPPRVFFKLRVFEHAVRPLWSSGDDGGAEFN